MKAADAAAIGGVVVACIAVAAFGITALVYDAHTCIETKRLMFVAMDGADAETLKRLEHMAQAYYLNPRLAREEAYMYEKLNKFTLDKTTYKRW